MKVYISTLYNIPQSVEVSKRCIESLKKFNLSYEQYPAFYKLESKPVLEEEKLKIGKWDRTYSDEWAVIANFVTQYKIWNKIISHNEPAIVCEHDAVFVKQISDLEGKGDIINLGKPSFGSYNKKDKEGIYPMFSKTGGYIPGAHGYYLTPKGAKQLVQKAREIGAHPCDLFLNNKNFPEIKECYPWPIEAHDSFSTIQKEKGCKAKHNYNKDFKIL